MRFIRPRYIFLFYMTSVIAFCSAAITERRNTGIAMFMLTLFFESVCFPTIVALGIRGQGRHTKRAAGWIVGTFSLSLFLLFQCLRPSRILIWL